MGAGIDPQDSAQAGGLDAAGVVVHAGHAAGRDAIDPHVEEAVVGASRAGGGPVDLDIVHGFANHHPWQALVNQAIVIDTDADIVVAVVIPQPHLDNLLAIRAVGIEVNKALVVAHGQRARIQVEAHAIVRLDCWLLIGDVNGGIIVDVDQQTAVAEELGGSGGAQVAAVGDS